VIEEVKHSYSLIGHSPMKEITARQRELLARELDLPVYVGMGTAESLSCPWACYAITSKCFTILISPSRTLPGSTTCVFGAPNL